MSRVVSYLSFFLPKSPFVLVYMLQQVEYHPQYFKEWIARFPNLANVIKRQKLEITNKAALLIAVSYSIWIIGIGASVFLLVVQEFIPALTVLLLTPFFVVLSLRLICGVGFIFLNTTRQKIQNRASNKMKLHPGKKIAVLGSYGKTTMKEILATVLSEGKNVAMSPGNKNVAISHARWIENIINGNEDIVIFELGEFRPGDIKELAKITQPNQAILTGVAPNHLENYASYDELKADLVSIGLFVEPKNLFVDKKTAETLGLYGNQSTQIDDKDVLGWKISDVKSGLNGTSFVLNKGNKKLSLKSGLLGEHLVLLLALAAALAHSFGLNEEQIKHGISNTKPFPHRMQPYNLNGAWIIDDTYNGNIEGMRAGLKMLKNISAKKKVYVTPGLVEQGTEAERVHKELGKLITDANPDEVVLMKNSMTEKITSSLKGSGFKGKTIIIDDPKHYYENLQYHVANGDIYLMQNDWTDNYN